ncbi:hypothetical protein PILCRDRAFT_815324 [Piloderma croceum F 1598]|uniref:Uncharacterized protein n=1 Tax=Piloderma croceum (strain F 1598) TaxID=765440 RepID=A0A0C3FS55_PILCF|nr:hypothetical protein PILCRDRAFT_815324 [Piloderma croceum F 1598]
MLTAYISLNQTFATAKLMSTTSTVLPAPTPAPSVSNGIYYIFCTDLNVYLEFTSSAKGANLTTWAFGNGGQSQQWQVALSTDPSGYPFYTFKNVLYESYVVFIPTAQGFMTASYTPSNLYISQSGVSQSGKGYLVSPNPNFSPCITPVDGSNVDNNTVGTWPSCYTWGFASLNFSTSVTPSPSATPWSSTSSTPANNSTLHSVPLGTILAAVLGSVFVIGLIVYLIFFPPKYITVNIVNHNENGDVTAGGGGNGGGGNGGNGGNGGRGGDITLNDLS